MRALRPLGLATLLVACGGAGESTPAEPPAPTPTTAEATPEQGAPEEADAEEDGPFLLELRRASGAMFRDQISVREDGQLVWVGQVVTGNRGAMHAVTLQLSAEEVRSVRRAVRDASFFALPSASPSDVDDGEQLILRVTDGERRHRVGAGEPRLAALGPIVVAVDSLLTDARRRALESAPEPSPEDFDPSLLAE